MALDIIIKKKGNDCTSLQSTTIMPNPTLSEMRVAIKEYCLHQSCNDICRLSAICKTKINTPLICTGQSESEICALYDALVNNANQTTIFAPKQHNQLNTDEHKNEDLIAPINDTEQTVNAESDTPTVEQTTTYSSGNDESTNLIRNAECVLESNNPVKTDNVDPPSHYQGPHECIDVMRAMFGDEAVLNFCRCNSFKYRFRADAKNKEEDIKKAEWYEHYVIKMLGIKPIDYKESPDEK